MQEGRIGSARDGDWALFGVVLVGFQLCGTFGLAVWLGFHSRPSLYEHSMIAVTMAALAGGFVALAFVARMAMARIAHPLPIILAESWKQRVLICYTILGFQLVGLQFLAHNWAKAMLPHVSQFWADPILADLDRAIFRADAWSLVHPAPQDVLRLFDVAYALWLPAIAATLALVLTRTPSADKTRLLIAYFITLGLFGSFGQFLFPSAGPVYFERIGLGNRFADLPIAPLARHGSDWLWANYMSGRAGVAVGISAMPSMHIALATWAVIVFRKFAPRLLAAPLAFWLLIAVGSVFLGWHYALDGVAGAVCAIAAWHLAFRAIKN